MQRIDRQGRQSPHPWRCPKRIPRPIDGAQRGPAHPFGKLMADDRQQDQRYDENADARHSLGDEFFGDDLLDYGSTWGNRYSVAKAAPTQAPTDKTSLTSPRAKASKADSSRMTMTAISGGLIEVASIVGDPSRQLVDHVRPRPEEPAERGSWNIGIRSSRCASSIRRMPDRSLCRIFGRAMLASAISRSPAWRLPSTAHRSD